jgi:hypothetical protein
MDGSYVTLTEAEAYFSGRLDSDSWHNASNFDKSKALITATTVLDTKFDWAGVAEETTQPLAFPRKGYSYYDKKVGTYVELTGTPNLIIKATLELALHFLDNRGSLANTTTLTDIKIDTIQLTGIRNVDTIPYSIKNLVNPLIINGGRLNWWRSN